jgi:hypothetical protein
MKPLLFGIALLVAALTPVLADGYGYDSCGRYHRWTNTPSGGYGFDGNGNYYRWTNTPEGGYGFDGNGNYFRWHNTGGR